MERIWILRRLKNINMSVPFMIDVYIKEVRSLLEQVVPAWNGGLTQIQIHAIERVQKTALYIILDKNYTNYEVACSITGLEPLDIRREEICLNFARKNLKSSDCLFIKANQRVDPRRKNDKVKEYFCHTKRFENSSLPYLAKLLNKYS